MVRFVLAGAVPAAVNAQQSATAAPALVFEDATVVDVEHGKLLAAQRVVVVGNRIQAMGSGRSVKLPRGAQVVDARGKYLIPGLWDLHIHPKHMASNVFYPLFLANGVTGFRNAGSGVSLDTLRRWRREILAGARVGPPRQILSGQAIAGPIPGCQRTGFTDNEGDVVQTCVTDEADARHLVDSLKAAGADMIKPRAVSRAIYFAIAAEARRQHIPFGGHAEAVTPMEVADSGGLIIDHVHHVYQEGAPPARDQSLSVLCWEPSATVERCRPIADRMRQTNTWLVPTLIRAADKSEVSYIIQQRFAQYATTDFWGSELPVHGNWLHWLRDSTGSGGATASGANSTMRIMHQVGLPILAGTDVDPTMPFPPGFALHTTLAMYVAEGLTPLEALQTATLNPAKMLRGTDSLGTVAKGKLADLVLLDADPLADITNTTMIRAVVANGRYFDRAALDRLVVEAQAKAGP